MTVLLNKEIAQAGANTGALLAVSHADRNRSGWSEDALEIFVLYANQHPEGFLTEDVRAWAEKLGFEPPPDNRAWGHVAKRAALAGHVRSAGFRKQSSVTCHGSFKTMWRKAQ